jgi:hypothetical protein
MNDVQLVLNGCLVTVSRIVVCLPFCHRDWRLMLENLKWQRELKPTGRFECVLIHDDSVPPGGLRDIEAAAMESYLRVTSMVYPTPAIQGWPDAPNYAFQCTAYHMEQAGRPWWWMEADCIPTKPGWMEALENEYDRGKKPFMGVVVPGMAHVNGVAIYPANTPRLLRKAMICTNVAWDSESGVDMVPLTHDVPHLIQHAWGVVGSELHPSIGMAPVFDSPSKLKWLTPTAAVFHRCKDNSLIQRLRERNK